MAHVVTIESAAAAHRRPRRPAPGGEHAFTMVVPGGSLWPSMGEFRAALNTARAGDSVALGVRLDTPIATRLVTLATFRWQRHRAVRAIRAAGGVVTGEYGVEPSLERQACIYEVNTAASDYAYRFMRPRGSAIALRRLAQRCFGCDPALGGVMIVGRKA